MNKRPRHFAAAAACAVLTTAVALAATAPSRELNAARAARAAAEKRVSDNARAARRIDEHSTQIRDVLQPNLAKQMEALGALKGSVGDIAASDASRATVLALLKGAEIGEYAAAAGTGGVSAFVKKGAEDAVKNLAAAAAFGDDPLGLQLQGATNMELAMHTRQGGLGAKLQELGAQLALSRDQVVAGAPADGWLSSFFSLNDAGTRALQAHNERVAALLDECLALGEELKEQQARTLEMNDRVSGEMWQKQFQFLDEQSKAVADEEKLTVEEKPKVVAVVEPAIVALKPPPPPPPPLPEPPPPVPEKTPLERYIEYYETGIGELEYYLPGWIATAKARDAAIRAMYAEIDFVLGVNGAANASLDFIQYALQPPEPEAAALDPDTKQPETLARLAYRHRQYLPTAGFYTEARVANAINSAETGLDRIKTATVALHADRNRIMSLRPYAEGMDGFYQTLGLGSAPPADLSVVRAFDTWPGIGIASDAAMMTLEGLANSVADLDYNGGRAPGLIRRVKGCVAVMEQAFGEKVASMTADLAELKPALAAYRSAFLRVEKALASYQAVAAASVIGRDRPSGDPVNYLNLDRASRQDFTRELSLWALDVSGLPADVRARVAAAKADVLKAEHHAAAYRAARRDFLLAWETVARLYPQFNAFDGATRREWTDAWNQQQGAPPDFPIVLQVPAPDFGALDAAPWNWIFNYVTGNPMLSSVARVEDLPVPRIESLDEVVAVLAAVEQAEQNTSAWSQLTAAQLAPQLQAWLEQQLAWARKRPPGWREIFGAWAAGKIASARDGVLMSHAFAKGDPAAPVITRQPAPVKVGRGQSAELAIEVQGTLYACDWYIYTPYAGSGYLLQACPANFGLGFQTPPVTADTLFVCRLRWGSAPDATNKILLSDVITVSVDDGANQSFNPVAIMAPKAGGSYEVQLTSTGPSGPLAWTSATSASWVSVPPSGPGGGSLSVVVAPNTHELARSARVTVGSAVLTVRQASSIDPPAGAPVFTVQPAGQTAALGGAVSFSATATGTAPISYQWRRGALKLSDGGRIAGATNSTLMLANVQAADAGLYTVVATNSVGTTTSTGASLTVTPAAGAPANDNLAAAAILGGTTAQASLGNAGATKETGEPRHAGVTGGRSLWWRWTAPASGPVSVDTIGSNLDTLLAVYTGEAVGALTAVAADDQSGGGGASALQFRAVAGTAYAIAVDGAGGSTGTVQLRLSLATAPANDHFANAQVIAGDTGSATGSNANATGESGEPLHVTAAGTASSIWYRWTATAAGSLTVDTIGSSFDTVLAAYAGPGLANLTKLAADDQGGGAGSTSRLAFNVTAGGTYHLAVGSFGTARGAVTLHWQYSVAPAGTLGPVISLQPQPQAVLAGANATFSVTADGTAPLTYQWKKDGVSLAESARCVGVTTATLRVNGVQAADAGSYHVVITNAAGAATSNAAALTLLAGGGSPPTVAITAPAPGAAFALGTPVAIAATAADADGSIASVKFAASGVELGIDSTSPYTASWLPAGLGTYSLAAIATDNSGNHTTATVPVTVGLPAAITQQPAGQSVTAGANVSFSVGATGTGLTYQWLRNGVPVPGATTATLALPNVQPAAAGNYEVVVDNAFGPAVTSRAAALTVTGGPAGYLADFDALTAGATLDGQGAPAWAAVKSANHVDPQVLAGDAAHATRFVQGPVDWRTSTAAQAVSPALVYPNGSYRTEWTCQMAVPAPVAGHGNTVAALVLAGPAGSATQGVLFGARGFVAGGTPPAGFTAGAVVLCLDDAAGGLHAGTTLSPATWYELRLVIDWRTAGARGSLSYRNLAAGETVFTPDPLLQDVDLKLVATEGQYTFNSATLHVFNGATIDRLSASPPQPLVPVISAQPAPQTVAAGGNATFSVTAAGVPPLSYQWRKDGIALANGASAAGAVIAGATGATLSLTGVQPGDAGTYTCQVIDATGATTTTPAVLAVTTGTDPVIAGYGLMKQRLTRQTSPGAPAPTDKPLSFEARVAGTNLAALLPPTFTSPAGSGVSGGVLAFHEASGGWRFSSASAYANLSGAAPALNADFADGAYSMSLGGATVTLPVQPMPGTTFPESPHVTGGTWLDPALQVDVTRDYTLAFDSFAGAAPGSRIWLQIGGPGLARDLRIETSDATATSLVIPAHTLTAGTTYAAHLVFLNATASNPSAVPGAVGVSGYAARLDFAVLATGGVPVISSGTSATGTIGSAFSYTITATNSPASFALGGVLPVGLTFNSAAGTITGTPLVPGASTVTLLAINPAGQSAPRALTITVAAATSAPANDAFANRTVLTGLPATGAGANVGATTEPGEPTHGAAGGASVWWTWTAPASGAVTVDTFGSTADTLLAVYTGTAVDGLTLIGANDDASGAATSAVAIEAVAGRVYQIVVDGYAGDTGTISLQIRAASMAPVIATQPLSQTVNAGGTVAFEIVATGTPAPAYRWQISTDGGITWLDVTDGAPFSGAATAALTISGVSVSQSRWQFRCAVTNAAGAVVTNPATLRVVPPTVGFAGADGFADHANWSAPLVSAGTGRLNFVNGRLEYTVAAPGADDFAWREWTANVGAYTQSWSVQVDVHLAALSLAATQYANLNLVVVDAADALRPAGQADVMTIAIDRYGTGSTTVHDFASDLVGNGNRIPAAGMIEVASDSTDAALRISFDASTKQLTSWYDADGAANGYAWTPLQSVNIGSGTYTWGMNETGTFVVLLVGGSGGVTLSPGQAYFDNFSAGGSAPALAAAHAVPGGYRPGARLTVTNTLTYAGTASALTWHVLLPDGWSLAGSSGTSGATGPAAGATTVLDWTWATVPPSPVAFTYSLNVPGTATAPVNLVAQATLTQDGVARAVMATPDPLAVALSAAHTADTDGDFRLGLLELTRVIELYNTRYGTERTGAYRVLDGSEDGFAADAARAPGAGATLPRYHSADTTPRDGRISLAELTRVIALYNHRAGTVRTGQYHVQTSPPTEDGFAPGP